MHRRRCSTRCRRSCSPTSGRRRRRRTNRRFLQAHGRAGRRMPTRRRSSGKASTTASTSRAAEHAAHSRASASSSSRPASTRRSRRDSRSRSPTRCWRWSTRRRSAIPRARRCSARDIAHAARLRPRRAGRRAPRLRRVGAAARTGRRRRAVARRGRRSSASTSALARLALRRIADNEMPVGADDQPERSADARAHGDGAQPARRCATRIAIASSPRSRAGAQRVAAAGADLPAVRALAAEAQLSVVGPADAAVDGHAHAGSGARALRRCATCCGSASPSCRRPTLDRWGVYAEVLDSRLKTAMPPPAPWEDFGGRADGGLIGTQAPDLIAAAGGRDRAAEAPGAARPGAADVRGPGLLARRRRRASRTTGRR